jgi:hypothetical protein
MLTNSKDFSESRIKILSFNLIGRLTPVYIHGWLFEQLLKSLRGLLDGFSQFVIDIIEAGRNFILDVLRKKTVNNCENRQRSYIKYFLYF